MSNTLTLALKDIKLLLRDKAGLFWVLGFPFLMALFFGAIYSGFSGGGNGTVRMIIVDEDQSEYSQKFTGKLDALKTFELTPMSYDSAVTMVRTGKRSAYLRLKEGFGSAQERFDFETGYIELGIDPSRQFTSSLIKGMIDKTSFEMMTEIFSNPTKFLDDIWQVQSNIDSSTTLQSEEKIKLKGFFSGLEDMVANYDIDLLSRSDTSETGSGSKASFMQGPKVEVVAATDDRIRPKSSYEITFPSAILWALIGCTMTFAVTIVNEKNKGTYTRLRLAPITRAQILGSKGMACFITNIFVSMLLLLFGKIVFGVRLDNFPYLLLALAATSFCFVGLMMFISVLGKTEQAISGAGMAIMLVMAMTGGGMIPLIVMPGWMRTISNFSIAKWGIISLEGAIWRNFSFSEMLLPVVISFSAGIVLFIIGTTILIKRDQH